MPRQSLKQGQAAGIAHAVQTGQLPKSKLKGASKQMAKTMTSQQTKEFSQPPASSSGSTRRRIKPRKQGRIVNE